MLPYNSCSLFPFDLDRHETVERNAELRTKAMRDAEEQKRLRRYRYCLLRVRFPDGIILQGKTASLQILSTTGAIP